VITRVISDKGKGEEGRGKRRERPSSLFPLPSSTLFSSHRISGESGVQKSLLDSSARQELLDRLERLTPKATARWGTMTAPQMLAHVADWMLMAKGELKAAPKNRPLRFPPLKQLAIYWLPFPKGLPTAPELVGRKPREWGIERAAVRKDVQWFGNLNPKMIWPDHPVFGKLTTKAWCVLGYRHTDHHLRQFGV